MIAMISGRYEKKTVVISRASIMGLFYINNFLYKTQSMKAR